MASWAAETVPKEREYMESLIAKLLDIDKEANDQRDREFSPETSPTITVLADH